MIIRTFLLVSLLRIFYCSRTVAGAIEYIRFMFTPNWGELAHPVQVLLKACAGQGVTLWYITIGIMVMFGVDLAGGFMYAQF